MISTNLRQTTDSNALSKHKKKAKYNNRVAGLFSFLCIAVVVSLLTTNLLWYNLKRRNVAYLPYEEGWSKENNNSQQTMESHHRSLVKTTGGLENKALGSLVLVRPISPWDIHLLEKSLEEWNQFIPCNQNRTTNEVRYQSIDLVLAYSRDLHQDDETVESFIINELILPQSSSAKKWNKCFGEIQYVNLRLSPEEDVYDPKQQGQRLDWVSGPNKVFRTVYQKIHEKEYETMFWMEMDTHPLQEYWLDTMIEELEEQRPFAILGSKYRGDKWDAFRSQLPTALLNHLNGNALYNLSSPYLNALVTQLEEESTTPARSVAYDYRIAKLHELVAVEKDIKQHSDFLTNLHHSTSSISKMQELLAREVGAMKETMLLGNFASTIMIDSMLPKDMVLQHGAVLFDEFDATKLGDITLVVSDFRGNVGAVLESVELYSGSKFAEVIVIIPFHAKEIGPFDTRRRRIRVVRRGIDRVNIDQCSVQIRTKWFMFTNSLHRLHPNVPIMTNERNEVLVWGVNELTSHCREDPFCYADYKQAESLLQNANVTSPTTYDQNDFLFHTKSHEFYCHFMRPRLVQDTTGYLRPSPTSFMAYLASNSITSLYHTVDRGPYGSRMSFRRSPESYKLEIEEQIQKKQLLSKKDNGRPARTGNGVKGFVRRLLGIKEDEVVFEPETETRRAKVKRVKTKLMNSKGKGNSESKSKKNKSKKKMIKKNRTLTSCELQITPDECSAGYCCESSYYGCREANERQCEPDADDVEENYFNYLERASLVAEEQKSVLRDLRYWAPDSHPKLDSAGRKDTVMCSDGVPDKIFFCQEAEGLEILFPHFEGDVIFMEFGDFDANYLKIQTQATGNNF